jgi:peptidoglycan/xylan/chitin deacetylase (PgdA/CDA1 family)
VHNRTAGRLLAAVALVAAAACGPAHAASIEHGSTPTVPDAALPHAALPEAAVPDAVVLDAAAEALAAPAHPAEPAPVAVASHAVFVDPVDTVVDAAVAVASERASAPGAPVVTDPWAPGCPACPGVQPDPPAPLVKRTGTAKPISSVPTTDPVVFLTIDDGEFWNEDAAALLEQARLPLTLFLTESYIADKLPSMHRLVDAGAWVEPHTSTHPNLVRTRNTATEICDPVDRYEREFGRRSTLFRPPYGNFNATTQSVVTSCGLQALVLWRASTNNGALATQGGDVRAGDIVLMHFRPDLADNLVEVFRILNERGLRVGRLECYVGGDPRCGQPWR